VQLVGIYVLLLYLCAKNDYSKSVDMTVPPNVP
jgi:hypothetical protein